MTTALDLTIAIPVKNEERNLPNCLKSIGKDLASYIVVIDSESNDKTQLIAAQFGAEIVNFKWDGKFPKKRNWFLRTYKIATKWILFLDADEHLTENFKSELRKNLERDDKVGYWLTYTIYFLGKKLKGGYPLRKLAVFKVGAGEYEKIDEDKWSSLDMEVHEHPVLKGDVGIIKNKIDHQDFRSVAHYINKHNEYASWEANRYIKIVSNRNIVSGWTWRQQIKYRLMRSILLGPIYFFGSFFLLGGFRDGARGWAFATLKMSYFTMVYCKIKEIKQVASSL